MPAANPPEQLAAIERVVLGVRRCFEENTPLESGVEIHAEVHMLLRVTPSGEVLSAEFAPPLAPQVDACSAKHVHAIRFPRTDQGVSLSRVIQLGQRR